MKMDGSSFYTIRQSDIRKCPFAIMMVPEHYRPDGTCRCDDPEHRAQVMIPEWGYTEEQILVALSQAPHAKG